MYFHLLNLEQATKCNEIDDSILLYLRESKDSMKKKILVKVRNIHTPMLIYFNDQNNLELKKERIQNILKRVTNGDIDFTISIVEKHNCFYPNIPEFSKYIQIDYIKSKISIQNILIKNIKQIYDGFLMIKDFENPMEQFYISTQLKVPCIININETNIKNTHGELIIDDYRTIKLYSYNIYEKDFNFKIAGIINEGENIHIGISDNKEYKPKTFLNFNDFQTLKKIIDLENIDLIIHHNLDEKILNLFKNKGILFINTFLAAKDTFKLRTYSVGEILNINTEGDDEIDKIGRLFEIFNKTNFLELSIHLAQICGGSFNKTLNCNRQKRIENLIFTEMYKNNMLLPPFDYKFTGKKYQGGLVLDPIKGYHENYVLLLDFISLYPTVILEYNVCFSTIGREKYTYDDKDLSKEELTNLGEESKNKAKAFLPKILETLINERQSLKEQYQNTKQGFLNIKQKALKLTANSIYGCLGFKNCRFYNSFMAKFITAMGRQLLLNSVSNLPKIENIRVIYGDTDSMMIDTGLSNNSNILKVKEIGNEIVKHINKEHNKLQIECENIFRVLLLYTKKKYAALTYLDNNIILETKGLDTTRSDYCLKATKFLSKLLYWVMLDTTSERDLKNLYEKNDLKDSFEMFLKQIQNKPNKNNSLIINTIKEEIKFFRKEIYQEKYNLEDFICTKKLSKDLNQYDDNLDFIKYCKKLINYDIKYKKDDIIEYIYVINETTKTTEMFHPKIFKNTPHRDFVLDINYYLKEQILPAVCRILIFSMSQEEIYKCFGFKMSTKEIRESVAKQNDVLKNFETPCCKKIQYLNKECSKCCKSINEGVIINFFVDSLKRFINKMYSIPEILSVEYCFNCNSKQNYSFLIKDCLSCGVDLQNYEKYQNYCTNNNWSVDGLINLIKTETARLSIDDMKFHEYIDNISDMSNFQKIDLKVFFPQEMFP